MRLFIKIIVGVGLCCRYMMLLQVSRFHLRKLCGKIIVREEMIGNPGMK